MKRAHLAGLFSLLLLATPQVAGAQNEEARAPQPEAEAGQTGNRHQNHARDGQRRQWQARGHQGHASRPGEQALRNGRQAFERHRRGRQHRSGQMRARRAPEKRLRSLSQDQRDTLRLRMGSLNEERRAFGEQMRERARPLEEERSTFRQQMEERRRAILNEVAPLPQSANQ